MVTVNLNFAVKKNPEDFKIKSYIIPYDQRFSFVLNQLQDDAGLREMIDSYDMQDEIEYVPLRICRKDWMKDGQYVVYQKGYPDGISCNKQTAEAWGIEEGSNFVCNAYLQIRNADGSHSMWIPSMDDLLANDWCIVNELNL